MFDVPGYAQIFGGQFNGQYVKGGQRYRRASDGTMYRIDTGTPAAVVEEPLAAEPIEPVVAAEPQPEPAAKPLTAADRAAMADGLVNDYTAEELTAQAIALASSLDVKFKPKGGEKAARNAAEFIAKHTGA